MNYQLPSLDFLALPDTNLSPAESEEELMASARLMQQTLAQFDVEVALGDITKGPAVTRFEFHLAPGVRMQRIQNLSNNLMAAIKADSIRVLAPIPGKSTVGVEVPNLVKSPVIMRDLLESNEWSNSTASIPIALGKDVYGHPIVTDLAQMPHCLIAGSTGSGKSVCINSIIVSLLYRFSPEQLRFVMIDPKGVELQQYNPLPHLVVPVVTDPKKVLLTLRWVVNEMEQRYNLFARVGVRNIKSFNERPKNKPLPEQEMELPLTAKKEKVEAGAGGFVGEMDEEIVAACEEDIIIPEKLSYIVVIIDELKDLMLVVPADMEMAIARITQMAQATGIHCIVATQLPNVDVITGVIKANIPARLSFRLPSKVDAYSIFDRPGAEELMGNGDFLFLANSSASFVRGQGALVTENEIQKVVGFIERQINPVADTDAETGIESSAGNGIDEDEETIQQCIDIIQREQRASVVFLQRRMGFGYTRAARMIVELERRGIIGPSKGTEPREIITDDEKIGSDSPTENANTSERQFTYTCPICANECSVFESLTGHNVVCPNCSQEFYATPSEDAASQTGSPPNRDRYSLPAKLPFFKSGRKQLLASRLAELVEKGKFTEADLQELTSMAVDLKLNQSDVEELQQQQMHKEFEPIRQRILSALMLTDEDDQSIRQLERKYGIKLSLEACTETLRASYIMATNGRLPPPIQTGLMLNDSEEVYHRVSTTWHQTRVNNYSFAGPSISIPIIKGVRYRVASYDFARREAMTPLSSGMLYITSKRLLFAGESRDTSINLSRIVNIQIFKDALEIQKNTGKSDLFSMEAAQAGYITTMIGVIRQLGL
jgi:hypothetical protein